MRSIGLVLALVLALGPLGDEAQNAVKTHTVGLLSPPPGAYVAAFEESLRQLGYVRGENVAFETAAASLAEAAGLRAFRTGNVVVIVTTERAKQVDEQFARLNPSFLGATVGFVDPGAADGKLKELEEKIKKLTEELEKSKK